MVLSVKQSRLLREHIQKMLGPNFAAAQAQVLAQVFIRIHAV